MVFQIRGRIWSAFSTTLLQNTLSIILACMHHAVMVARMFGFGNVLFQRIYIRLANLTLGLSFLHVTGGAFNVSLLWIEIASCRQFQIVKNVSRTKHLLITVIALMYILYLSVGFVGQNSRLAMMIWYFFLLALIISCGIGSAKLAIVLSKDLHDNAFLDEADLRRNEVKRSEIGKILATSTRVCVFFCYRSGIQCNLCCNIHETKCLSYSYFVRVLCSEFPSTSIHCALVFKGQGFPLLENFTRIFLDQTHKNTCKYWSSELIRNKIKCFMSLDDDCQLLTALHFY